MSSSNNDNIEGQPPPAKRQRRSLGASDRVVLDVGGTKFITSSSTLTTNSAYFAALLSDNWIESNNGEDEIFIDQDATPFSVLLAYMRQGNIEVDEINTKVLSLAEFLGMERLLLAIKVRWYCNIGRGSVHTTDDEIAVAFDQEYGGVMKAVSSGLFPHFLKPNDINAEKEFATLRVARGAATPGDRRPIEGYKLEEVGKSGPMHDTGGLVGALSGLHLKGYTHYERQLKTMKDTYTFSRRKHAMIDSEATDIFIPNNDEIVDQERNNQVKQFAIVVVTAEAETLHTIFAPAEFHEDESRRSDPLNYADIRDPGPSWLENNGFVTHENEYEDIFRELFKANIGDDVKISIFSHVTSKRRDDASW